MRQLHQSQAAKIVCILPSAHNGRSNGIVTLCEIYKALQKAAPMQTLLLCKPHENKTFNLYKEMYGDGLITYSDQDKNNLLQYLRKDGFLLVRPDDLEGIDNEIHWDLSKSKSLHLIINILLAPPFAFANKISILDYYSKKDFFLLANQAIMPAFAGMENNDLFIESELDPLLLKFNPEMPNPQKSTISIYIGKGLARPLPYPILKAISKDGYKDFALIKRSWPTTKEDFYSLLAASKLLISYDPFSHIERVSTYLGTPVIKLCNYNLRELPGVFAWPDPTPFNLKNLPRPVALHLTCKQNYLDSLLTSKASLSNIASIITKSSNTSIDKIHLIKGLIPFSKKCLLAFSSQLRGLMPYIGTVSMAHANESLEEKDLIELIAPEMAKTAPSSTSCSYKARVDEFPIPRNFSDPHGIKQVFCQYTEAK